METILSTLSILPEGHDERDSFLEAFKIEIENDTGMSAFEYHKRISFLEKLLTEAKEITKEHALNEASMYDKKELQDMGIEVKQTGRYDYSSCDVWKSLKKALDNHQKSMQQAYKSAVNGKTNIIINEDTGEVIQPASYTKNNKSITIKNK